MSRERIIKQQARESLRGNITALIAGFLALAVMGVIIFDVPVFAAYLLNLVDAESGEVTGDSFLWYLLLEFGALVLAAVFSPLINGFFRLAADTAVKGGCEINSFFYFFSSPRRYFRTLAVNMGLCALYSLLTAPLAIAGRLLGGVLPAPAITAVLVIWQIFVYIFFIHYPLAAYAINDSRPAYYYVFGFIGFSFRCSGALIKLIFSMLGWIALCFFIIPTLYVVPYLAVTLMNSARWLFAMNNKI